MLLRDTGLPEVVRLAYHPFIHDCGRQLRCKNTRKCLFFCLIRLRIFGRERLALPDVDRCKDQSVRLIRNHKTENQGLLGLPENMGKHGRDRSSVQLEDRADETMVFSLDCNSL